MVEFTFIGDFEFEKLHQTFQSATNVPVLNHMLQLRLVSPRLRGNSWRLHRSPIHQCAPASIRSPTLRECLEPSWFRIRRAMQTPNGCRYLASRLSCLAVRFCGQGSFSAYRDLFSSTGRLSFTFASTTAVSAVKSVDAFEVEPGALRSLPSDDVPPSAIGRAGIGLT